MRVWRSSSASIRARINGESAGTSRSGTAWPPTRRRNSTLEEIKTAVLASYNARIDEAIRSGFRWEETPVWLSAENQFNYKAAFDLAVQTNGANLPVVFKLGTDEKPVYREFTTVDELRNFYTAAMAHVQDTLAAGWKAKDEIDFGLYRV